MVNQNYYQMKKLITIILFLTLTISCSDDKKNKIASDTKIGQAQNDTYLKATIDGETFYTKTLHNYSSQDLIVVAGTSKDKNQEIRITIDFNKGLGTYTLGKESSCSMIYTNTKVHWIASKHRGEGTITITEEDGYYEGKFNFIGTGKDKTDKKQITDGEFRVKKK